VTKKTNPPRNTHTASLGNEPEAIACPNCDYWLEMVSFANYIIRGNTLADYRKFECRNCGYVLHKYSPYSSTTPKETDDIPF
jgi:DNA-directed RNA polymerase subunit RPC12/RpoP